jgi:hypothetical protein
MTVTKIKVLCNYDLSFTEEFEGTFKEAQEHYLHGFVPCSHWDESRQQDVIRIHSVLSVQEIPN